MAAARVASAGISRSSTSEIVGHQLKPLPHLAIATRPKLGRFKTDGKPKTLVAYHETEYLVRGESIRAARKAPPPIMPAVATPAGPMDLSSVLFRNRIIFIGQPVNSQVAQRAISQLMTLAAVNEDEEIQMYINCPGGSTYSVLAIYDCMSWIKPKIKTVCFGIAASQGALLLAGGEKGRRFAMPNARIMIHQPQGGCGGTMEDVRRQVNEVVASRDKIDKMYAAFTGQPVERVQRFTDRDHFFSAAEAMEFGLIDGLLETEY
ncbi:hypothetical protein GOP47_0022033 [Adiantum capillus-veneris]|uniref:ATP-dependent Clp protease proteolytic subunit n=1 Tax=Adiantum capillus-veneris TaxID=13818 RepID=A0A9D4U8K0_ADICA|nr:hypothetical protein GOP47_0022033 [Adiantum capillus-veneris]